MWVSSSETNTPLPSLLFFHDFKFVIINDAPNIIDRGIVFVVSRPTQSLTICGITSPIQLIVPANATELAVIPLAYLVNVSIAILMPSLNA